MHTEIQHALCPRKGQSTVQLVIVTQRYRVPLPPARIIVAVAVALVTFLIAVWSN